MSLFCATIALSACSEHVEHYAARGLVTAIDAPVVTIHHEHIDAFKDRDGQPAAMPSMKMNFTLLDPSKAGPLAAGDKVSFEFDVRWNLGLPLQITRIQKLPPDTPLTLTEH